MLNRDWSSESSLNEKRIIPAQYHLSMVVGEMAKENRKQKQRNRETESSLNALWKENYSGAISFIHGCGGDGKGKQMIGCVGNKGKCWQGGETVKKCHKHQMYLPKLFNVDIRQSRQVEGKAVKMWQNKEMQPSSLEMIPKLCTLHPSWLLLISFESKSTNSCNVKAYFFIFLPPVFDI